MVKLSVHDLVLALAELEPTVLKGAEALIQGFASPESASSEQIVFLHQAKHLAQVQTSAAGALVTSPALWAEHGHTLPTAAVILCAQPYVFFAYAAQFFDALKAKAIPADIHPTASIAADVVLGEGVSIGAHAVIEAGARIGAGSRIGAQCFVGAGASLGKACLLHPHVTVYHDCHLGAHVIAHAGSVIGADGFGFAPHRKAWVKIPQTGRVLIGDDVEIGAGTCIDRGALGDTVIGRGTKLDNLIQIAHNVRMGEDCAFAACVAVAGSAVIGNRVQAGGGAGILGHLSVCDDVVISTFTLITKTIHKPGFYTGVYPFEENADWEKNAVSLRRLSKLREQVKQLEKSLANVQANQN